MKRRTKFSLSHYNLGTCKMGQMIPIGLTEVLPGDSIRHAASAFLRLAPMMAPIMHPVRVNIHHWYIPLRLLWDDFEDFITGGPDGLDVSVFPTIKAPSSTGFATGSLADYLGLPPGIPDYEVSALPFRAYALLYNDWYRDQDLETPLTISTDSGLDTTTSMTLKRGDWERDYFTTARPWPQKGPDVSVPVDTTISGVDIPVVGQGAPQFKLYNGDMATSKTSLLHRMSNLTATPDIQSIMSSNVAQTGGGSGNLLPLVWDTTGLTATGQVTGEVGEVNINALREAFALQRFAEHRALYGSRYTEYLRYLGVRSSDSRLQRPEYLGGGRQSLQFSEVLQTAEGDDPVGTMRGHGIGAMRSNRYRRFIEEHGYILSVMTIRPKAIYMQSIPRTWLRRVKEDFWQKELEHIGQQEVMSQELYAAADPGTVFGYQNRYDEYREHNSYVCSEYRNVLDYWHLARSFGNEPVLNSDFIECVPSERIFASSETDQIYYMINHSMQARRLLARFGNPI